jgi:hypothetical protein
VWKVEKGVGGSFPSFGVCCFLKKRLGCGKWKSSFLSFGLFSEKETRVWKMEKGVGSFPSFGVCCGKWKRVLGVLFSFGVLFSEKLFITSFFYFFSFLFFFFLKVRAKHEEEERKMQEVIGKVESATSVLKVCFILFLYLLHCFCFLNIYIYLSSTSFFFFFLFFLLFVCLKEYSVSERERVQQMHNEVEKKQKEVGKQLEEIVRDRKKVIKERDEVERERIENMKKVEEVLWFVLLEYYR